MKENKEQNLSQQIILEALLFSTAEPISVEKLMKYLDYSTAQVSKLVESLNLKYEQGQHAFRIELSGAGYQFRTIPEASSWIIKLKPEIKVQFSAKIMETLAVIAYKQPISKHEVDSIRGVDSGYAIKILIKQKLVKIAGRSNIAGNPLIYKTTAAFLNLFGFSSLADLPRMGEFKDFYLDSE